MGTDSMDSTSKNRTGCPQFWKHESGVCTSCLSSLQGYSEQLKDMVTFVLDCSFSLEEALEKGRLSGRNPADHSHAAAHKTTVPCAAAAAAAAGFCCPLVVTARPIPKDELERLLQVLCSMAELLGINELSKSDYGDHVACQPGDIPVFWPSQLTSLEAIGSCSTLGPIGTPMLA